MSVSGSGAGADSSSSLAQPHAATDDSSSNNPAGAGISASSAADVLSSASDGLTAKERDNLNLHSSAFDALERDFREVLNELVGDKSLERFRIEYEKLHHTLKKSHENEKRLIAKCRELNAEIVSNAAKIQTALRLSLQDQNSITLLKKEIDKAWKLVDGAQEKEKRARETIARLKSEIQNLSRLVDQGAGLSIGQENAVNDLLKIKDELSAEVEAQQAAIATNQRRIAELEAQVTELEANKAASDKEMIALKEKSAKVKAEAARETRRADRLQAEMMTLKEVNDKRKSELQEKNSRLEELSDRCLQLDSNVRALTAHIDKQAAGAEDLAAKNAELAKSVDFHVQRANEVLTAKQQLENDVASLTRELRQKSSEVQAMTKKKERAEKEATQQSAARQEAERYRNWLKDEMKNILKAVEAQRKESAMDEGLIRELQQQVKRLTATLHLSAEKNNMQLRLVEEHEQVKQHMEEDIVAHKLSEQELRKKNYKLEKEKESEANRSNAWAVKYAELQESLRVKELEAAELRKSLTDEQAKLKLQQTLYEQVRADRNLFSKQQVASEDEIAELKRKFKILSHQIDQLKEELGAKDAALINEHFAYKRLQDELKVSKRKLAKRKEVLSKADAVLASQDAEIKNLRRTLQEAEAAQHAQKRIYDDVVQERDILGTQLIRRNDELALLYEKMRIQQATLSKGEQQYRDRLQDIRRLKREMNNTRRQLQIRSHEVTNIEALKNEVYHVQRELLQERTKVKALSEELENPMNVHRWRKLEGSDPKRYELLQKIQTLQQRLIVKTELVVEKDLLLQEKEKLYVELKNLLARQPGPEVAEQLSKYQQSLKEKTRAMKAMAAEINMMQAQASEYRYEMERTARELADTKRKLYEGKRKEQLAFEKTRAEKGSDPLAEQQRQFLATQPRITGGGFNLQPAQLNATAPAVQTVAH